jgi:hypothetical protein
MHSISALSSTLQLVYSYIREPACIASSLELGNEKDISLGKWVMVWNNSFDETVPCNARAMIWYLKMRPFSAVKTPANKGVVKGKPSSHLRGCDPLLPAFFF